MGVFQHPVRSLRETFVVNENEVFIVLGASGVNP